MARVVVIGGGLAGCSAALALAEAGWGVTLCEKRATLGGRACAFRPPGWDIWLDNSQHVLLRCCTNQLDLYQRLGVADQIDWHERITLMAGDGRRGAFAGWPLPAPLHLSPALAGLPRLSLGDRAVMAVAFGRMLLAGRDTRYLRDRSFRDWLGRATTPGLDRGIWKLMLTSVLNADADRVSADAALFFFRQGLLRHPSAFHLGVPRVSLHELHHEAMLQRLLALGVEVRLGCVGELRVAAGRVAEVMANGEPLAVDEVVLAVPWWQVRRTLDGPQPLTPDALEPEAIVGVHLRYDRPVLDLPVVGLMQHDIDWVLGFEGGRRLSIVVSDARSWAGMSAEAMVARTSAALRPICGDLPAPVQSAACRERRSTFVPGPGSDAVRPTSDSGIAGLTLAGEWTATGWPSTMEGAVRSGYAAAERLLGRPVRVPDLPRSGLMRWALAE